MNLTINGDQRNVEARVLTDLVPADSTGIAVAVNGTVVPRGLHGSHPLTEGDVIDIVTATQGG